ncbi:MAG: serine--tRNA ligase [Elusimicrobia bacterium]|nr:serine--tRNA ligase [Elusimicrobiota bacterium]
MNDPKLIREKPEAAKEGLQKRGGRYMPYLDQFLKDDEAHRALLKDVESTRAKQNELSKEIGKAKAAKDEAAAQAAMAEVAALKAAIKEKEPALEAAASRIREALLSIPNFPHASCPDGKSEADNVERRKGPLAPRTFDFKPLDHQSVGEKLGILDIAAAAKLSGSRFSLLRGAGARLERTLIDFMLDLHTTKHGYEEIWPPVLVRPEILEGTGQLPKFKEDMYLTQSSSSEGKAQDMYLISTSEIALTNLVREEILDESRLPMKLTAYTPCFRQEAGSYGKDTRGLIRVHQFDKVELVWITKPEDSLKALEELVGHAAAILEALEIPYRVIELCTADIGFGSCKTYDLELWMPSENRYREISSCSNCWDFQGRRMNARFRRGPKGAPEFVHTLNGSGVAVGRMFAAILENYQQKDGSVSIPKALQARFGADAIKPG